MAGALAVGDLTIQRVIELEGRFVPALDMLPGLTPELLAANREWMQPHALTSDDVLILCFQSYVVRTPHHTILVDTCIGNHKQVARPAWNMKTDDNYMRALAAVGLTVHDIDYVMCTHLHVDHVGWNTRLDNGRWVPTFPNARYVFGRQEYEHWDALSKIEVNRVYLDSVLPVVEAGRADLVDKDFQLGDHVRILPTPGHTPGHTAICFGKSRDDAVMTGDMFHTPLQMRYPGLSSIYDVDRKQAAATRWTFLEKYCGTDTLCCTAHFPSPTIGRIKRWDEGFKCELVTA